MHLRVVPFVLSYHQQQKRILTLREYARAQGFPDWFTFLSGSSTPSLAVEQVRLDSPNVWPMFNTLTRGLDSQKYRQIGNAVPVHLARALGDEVLKASMKARHNREEEEADAQARELSPEI